MTGLVVNGNSIIYISIRYKLLLLGEAKDSKVKLLNIASTYGHKVSSCDNIWFILGHETSLASTVLFNNTNVINLLYIAPLKLLKFIFFSFCSHFLTSYPPEGSHKVNDKVRLHNLCHTKVKSNPPIITSKTIYPMKYGNYSLSLIWIAPESSERIHIYSYHIQWTVISKNANSNSKNYYNNSVFIESHDIALRRHIYDEVSRLS